MARKVKFSVTATGLVKQVAALILLSATAESLQCYWCGPLAEQVHRSTRPPPCDAPNSLVTACDPGYTHCATVASSPPLAESRYCVKLYQDECYTLYCGTTKTYKMICPCQGELCNGPKTEREIEAFAALATRTQHNRIDKRNTIPASDLTNSEDKNITEQNTIKTEPELDVDNDISETIKASDLKNNTDLMEMQADQDPVEIPVEHNESGNMTNDAMNGGNAIKHTQGTTPDHKEITEMAITTNAEHVEMTTTPKTEVSMPSTQITKVEKPLSSVMKSEISLPTAEALQQNSETIATSEKPMEKSTEATQMTTTETIENMGPTNATRNKAKAIYAGGTFLLLNYLVVILII